MATSLAHLRDRPASPHSRQSSLLSTLSDSFSSSYYSHSLSSHSRQASLLSSPSSHSRHSSQISDCTSPPPHLQPPSSPISPFTPYNAVLHYRQPSASPHHSRQNSYDNPAYSSSPSSLRRDAPGRNSPTPPQFKLPPSFSPQSADLGYHTMVGAHSSPSLSPAPSLDLSYIPPCPQGVVRPRPPAVPGAHTARSLPPPSFQLGSTPSPLLLLPDALLLVALGHLDTHSLVRLGLTCRRLRHLCWEPSLWHRICLQGEVAADLAISCVLATLAREGGRGMVRAASLQSCTRLTDHGLGEIARHCPALERLEVRACRGVTNSGVAEVVARCPGLHHLNLAGCSAVSGLSPGRGLRERLSRGLALTYLDLTDCTRLDDQSLRTILQAGTQVLFLYLRRCVNVTDQGIKLVSSYCFQLRELSVSDCPAISDEGLLELARLGPSLRYLSAAKCHRITDHGVTAIARHCYKLRYLNIRGCEAVSDTAVEQVARSCGARLRSLDVGKCDVTDQGLQLLAQHCTNLKKLSVRGCEMVGDIGVSAMARSCRGLQQLNIQDCRVGLETYRSVRRHARSCIIEHTNPGFH